MGDAIFVKKVAACLLSACLGVCLGYLGAYVQYANERDHRANYSAWEHEWLGLPGLPGILIASSFRKYDYGFEEAWHLDKHKVALWNGVVFLPLGLIAGLWKRGVARK